MIIEKHFLIILNMSVKSSSNSPSVQVLHNQFKGGGGVKTYDDFDDSEGGSENLLM